MALPRLRSSCILWYLTYTVLFGLALLPIKSFSQQGDNPFAVNILPPSPEASALAKYAEIPISLYAGIPQISIPLYEIKERELNLPISLSYHSSGHKVETIAPRTGLGFSVLAEGVVTRTVMGWPDEHTSKGFLSQVPGRQISDYFFYDEEVNNLPAARKQQLYNWYDGMAEGCIDLEPDQFYFNLGGHTGKFVFGWDGVPVIDSESKIRITPIGMNPGTNDFIDGWNIVTEDGTTYVLDVIERSDVMQPSENSLNCRIGLREEDIPQSWYLREIRSANQQSWIRFEYDNYTQTTQTWSMELKIHNANLGGGDPYRSMERIETFIYGKHLRKITTSSGQTTIDFLPGAQRTDVSGTVYTLGSMIVKNVRGSEVKKWVFNYDYSIGRLTLKSLTEMYGSIAKPPYTFSYYGSTLPDINSYSKDHWGFFNDNLEQTLVPATETFIPGTGEKRTLSGANREPSPAKATIGMLHEIRYPSGGRDILDFEPHDYSFKQNVELIKRVTIPMVVSGSAPEWDTPEGDTHTEERPFTLTYPADLTYNYYFNHVGGGFGGGVLTPVSFAILRSDGSTLVGQSGNGTPRGDVVTITNVPAGNYKLVVSGRMGSDQLGRSSIAIDVGWQQGTDQIITEIRPGGGVRIAKITRKFGYGNQDKVTKYLYRLTENGIEKSSGSLLELGYRYDEWYTYMQANLPSTQKFYRFAQSRTALGTTHGSHVGYGLVTVIQGENGGIGKTTYKYNSPREFSDYQTWQPPYPPAESSDYQRGLLVEQTDYSVANIMVRKITNTYRYHEQQVYAIKAAWKIPGDPLSPRGPGFLPRYARGIYRIILGYSRLRETKEINYPPSPASPVETITVYTHNENTHKQLVQVAKLTSNSDSLITRFTYPHDYSPGSSTILETMKNRNMINTVIENFTLRRSNSSTYLNSAIKNTFKDEASKIVPAKISGALISSPVATSNPITTASGLYEDRLIHHTYDTYGNITEHSMKDGTHTAYIWGWNGTLPIAKVDQASSSQIFHTSFEEDNSASETYSKTGKKSKLFNGTYTLPASANPTIAGDYILTYFAKQGTASWVYNQREINNYQPGTAININITNGYLDEVRLFPKGATMTTYTYEPLVGVTSKTDANNVTIYYEYDEFNRLSCIKDQDQNILECNDYKYLEEVPFLE